MKKIVSYVAVVIAVAVTGCTKVGSNQTVVISAADNGTVVNIARGGQLQVVLSGNPTTGFEWTVDNTDESLLTSAGSTYTRDSDMIGAGGTYRFQFNAVAAGTVHLRLVNKRSWESTVAETFEVTVKIS